MNGSLAALLRRAADPAPRRADHVAGWGLVLTCADCGRRLSVDQVEGQQFGSGRRRVWCGACVIPLDQQARALRRERLHPARPRPLRRHRSQGRSRLP
jgi:hypothetical protein